MSNANTAELYEAARALHAALRDTYIPYDSAYQLGYRSNDYTLFKQFEDAILAVGPLLPVEDEDEDERHAEGRLIPRD